MELEIILPDDGPKQGIINLKDFIDKASIEGLEKMEIKRGPHKTGEMGAGIILNSIATVVSAATEPLVALFECLQRYVDNYRTVITIPTSNGNITLQHGRSMKSQELKDLVTAIQQNANTK